MPCASVGDSVGALVVREESLGLRVVGVDFGVEVGSNVEKSVDGAVDGKLVLRVILGAEDVVVTGTMPCFELGWNILSS